MIGVEEEESQITQETLSWQSSVLQPVAPESCESLSTSSLTGALYVYQCLQYTNSTGSFIQGTAAYEWLKVKLSLSGVRVIATVVVHTVTILMQPTLGQRYY